MFKRLRLSLEPKKTAPTAEGISISQFIGDASLPVTLKALNSLPINPKMRLYRTLIPIQVLAAFDINPRTWQNPDKQPQVRLLAEEGSDRVKISAWQGDNPENEFFYLELADNPYNGIDLNFLVANDPASPKFHTDLDDQGRATLFGTVHRNLSEEERAMRAGLAPGQVREGLRCSQIVFTHIETFLTLLAHHAITLEPLTYASAWIFERRGFAYARGHQLMDSIQREFQPGGELHKALDGSTAFRQPEQWKTVRGRAWAIHDGILDVIDRKWDNLKMIKQVGRQAGVNTCPDAQY
ncbi:MAG: hypothetical protein CVU44_01655 [Chloroflexi bacterium HGW-Chloroflexi-6]|nr:MAG: hypothetical protein CVU44_01655 [Chloroflexi bacterium HGW-Chloroflexi-6]